jgi:hypothetical protein
MRQFGDVKRKCRVGLHSNHSAQRTTAHLLYEGPNSVRYLGRKMRCPALCALCGKTTKDAARPRYERVAVFQLAISVLIGVLGSGCVICPHLHL